MYGVINGTFVSFLRSNILHDFDRYLMSRQVCGISRYFCRPYTEYSQSVSNIILLLYFFHTCNQSSLLSPTAFWHLLASLSEFPYSLRLTFFENVKDIPMKFSEDWRLVLITTQVSLLKGLSVVRSVRYNDLLQWIENKITPRQNILSLPLCLAARCRNILRNIMLSFSPNSYMVCWRNSKSAMIEGNY